MKYEPVVGLEVHAELQTRSKMFCSCPVVDSTQAAPNTAVCPVCLGLPGVLPVINRKAVEMGLQVALALGCKVHHTSIFARKNYFYPDLPKGYQISQYEFPLAENGCLPILTSQGEKAVHIRRVHLEEDTGKLTHVENEEGGYSLVDLNRAGVALLEIVSEPEMNSVEEVRAYARELHTLLRHLGVNSGDMSKGVLRFEANLSMRPVGSKELGTRVEIKNLNSFKAMERALLYQIERQTATLQRGNTVAQETLGWDDAAGCTYAQRSKEEAHDYRYFPEPDLPPLVVADEWVQRVREWLPELPFARARRFEKEYGLSRTDASILVDDAQVGDYFEECVRCLELGMAELVSNWVSGALFAWMNQNGVSVGALKVRPPQLAELLKNVQSGMVNQNTAKTVLDEMLQSGKTAGEIIEERGLQQVSDQDALAKVVRVVLDENPQELETYRAGKETLVNWFFGQAMRKAEGKADPSVLRAELNRQLKKKG